MVVRSLRKRHQQRGLARSRKLRDRASGARQHQIRCRILCWHVREKRLDRPARRIGAACRIGRSRGLQMSRSSLVNDAQPRNSQQQSRRDARHRVVEHLRSLAACGHQQLRRRTERLLRQSEDLRPNRNSGRFGVAEVGSCLRKVHCGCVHVLAQHSIRQSWNSVRLIGERRNAQQERSNHRRPACIAADADDHLRPELAQDSHALQHAERKVQHRAHARCHAHVLQLTRTHQVEPESGLGNQPRLQPARCADKPHLKAMFVAQLASNGKRRNHMAAGTAAGNDHPQRIHDGLHSVDLARDIQQHAHASQRHEQACAAG